MRIRQIVSEWRREYGVAISAKAGALDALVERLESEWSGAATETVDPAPTVAEEPPEDEPGVDPFGAL